MPNVMLDPLAPACLTDVQLTYGTDEESSWATDADGWTFELTTDHGTEAFSFWVGRGQNGREPEVWELIHCLVSDQQYLDSEPESVSYGLGQKITANSQKMQRLFGRYWQTLLEMDEDAIVEAF
jgi:hypothetical protein